MPPAATLLSMHECPMQTPAIPPIPHVGGPVLGPGATTVLIAGLPAARVGDMLLCIGPPDSITSGSSTVMIEGEPAAYLGSATEHGGTIVMGVPNVMIGA